MFSAEFFIHNRAKLRKIVGDKIIVVAGNSLMQRTGDTNFPFRQNSDFYYLTGVDEPDLCLVIDGKNNTEFIMLNARTGVHKIFDGDYDHAEIAAKSGVGDIRTIIEGLAYINEQANGIVLMNIAQKWNKTTLTLNGHRLALQNKLKRRGLSTEDIRPYIAGLRMIKQPAEIASIQQAITITKQALTEIESLIPTALNENDLDRELNVRFAQAGVGHAFGPIIQAGLNTTILHYDKHSAPIGENTVVLFDIGAEYQKYAADISRTYIKGANERAKKVIAAVTDVQKQLIAHIKPGRTWRELHEYSEQLTLEKLKELGITNNPMLVRQYFPHAFGHFVGLDTHDSGDYTTPLQAGMTITVEPGIYLPEEQIGVRIEDVILVTETNAKVL
jgi:Xaa-Pro aminopeptidase